MNIDPASSVHSIERLVPRFVRRWLGSALRVVGIEVRLRAPTSARLQTERPEPCWGEIRAGPAYGACIYLDDPGHRELLAGDYESFMYDALVEAGVNLEGKTIWDVGTYTGYHTLALASLVGRAGHVIAFEPNPETLQRLRQHLSKNPVLSERIQLRSEALSNTDGLHSFRLSSKTASRSYLDLHGPPSDRFSPRSYEQFDTISVTVAQADSLVEAGLLPPRMMKIDVEGAEVEVLEGSRELLARERPVLAIEVHNITCMFHIQSILIEHGYMLRLLDSGCSSSSRAFVLATPPTDTAHGLKRA